MSVTLSGFDANNVPEQMDFAAIPPGDYVCIATSSEQKPNKAGTGSYLQFTFEVLDGQFKGRKLWARLNLWNKNQTAKDIAERELGAFCRAVGVPKPHGSAELHNKPVLLGVAVEKSDRGNEQNEVKKYSPVPGRTPVQAQRQQAQPANYQQGAQQNDATAQQPQAEEKAPWA